MKYLDSRNRAILREMVSTDFKIRYQNSVLGYVWSVLKPLFLFAILYVLFTYILPMGEGVEHYGVILLVGIVLWSFFSETTMMGANSIVANGDLIRKINIPRYLIVISSSLSALINLSINFIVVAIFSLINGILPSLEWLLLIPVIVELYILAIGIAFLLAALFVKFRDVTYIWEIFLQAGFYASVIIFPISKIPENIRDFFFINPIVQIVQDARSIVLGAGDTMTIWNGVGNPLITIAPFVVIAISVALGGWYFKRRSRYFAEDI